MNKPSKADKLIYKALNKAIEKDQLRLYFDYGRINRPGSPVYDVMGLRRHRFGQRRKQKTRLRFSRGRLERICRQQLC